MSKQFQKCLSKEHRKHGVIDQVKHSKIASKRKCVDREYHVQDNSDVAHKEVKMYCDKINSEHCYFLFHMEQGG